jgi:hypothetical protein
MPTVEQEGGQQGGSRDLVRLHLEGGCPGQRRGCRGTARSFPSSPPGLPSTRSVGSMPTSESALGCIDPHHATAGTQALPCSSPVLRGVRRFLAMGGARSSLPWSQSFACRTRALRRVATGMRLQGRDHGIACVASSGCTTPIVRADHGYRRACRPPSSGASTGLVQRDGACCRTGRAASSSWTEGTVRWTTGIVQPGGGYFPR